MASYYRWSTASDVPLFLQLVDPSTQLGSSGKSPEVAIRRHRLLDGTVLDGNYWNGSSFVAGPVWLSMSEFDATDWPGLYLYDFQQSSIAVVQAVYLVYYRHTSAPTGFDVEEHVFTDELYVPGSSPAIPVVPSTATVMGRLALMEDPNEAVAQANADAVWDEALASHLTAGTTGEALAACCAAGKTGARQIDITVEDTGANPIQGATIDFYDSTNTSFIFRVYSDTAGEATVAVDDGTYSVRLFASGYSFTVPEVLVVTADAPVTWVGTALQIIVPPASPDHCLIYGSVHNAGGTPIAGACVAAFARTPQSVDGWQKSEIVASTLTNSDGFFEIELVRETEVLFRITDPEGNIVLEEIKTVPDAPTQALETWT